MKTFANLLLLCLSVVSTACNKDEPESPPPPYPIVIPQIDDLPGDVTFDRVEAEITGFEWEVIGKAEGVYENGGATLLLPVDLPEESLCKAVRDDAADYTGFWYADTDDPKALVAGLGDIFAYSGQTLVGRLYQAAKPDVFLYYHFADRPYELSGSYGSFRYAASFERGWNVYAKISQGSAVLVTTEIPAGELKWYFEKY